MFLIRHIGRISNTAAITNAATSLAARQHGVASRAQLRRIGLSDDRIDGWVRAGRMRRVFSGVYAVGRPGITQRGRLQAAVLACGPGAVISHRSAAWLLGLREVNPVTVDVICRGQAGRKVDGIRVHNVPYPAPSEVRRVAGIPCTTVARTIVDLAGTHGIAKLRETVEMAATRKKLDIVAIEAVLANGPRRRGAPALRTVIDEWRPVAETAKYATVRSLFEAKLLPLIAAARLPIPQVNARVRTADRVLEVDLLWPEQKLVVEADSRRHHAIEVAFERDHKRTRELIAAGYGVIRVSWREAEREPQAVFAVLRTELEARAYCA
ncbi:MAG TPA: type IV toxin-antitoxin system AbiEi family antitoxin domain-containing protein [Solirubrobacterales bacterium]